MPFKHNAAQRHRIPRFKITNRLNMKPVCACAKVSPSGSVRLHSQSNTPLYAFEIRPRMGGKAQNPASKIGFRSDFPPCNNANMNIYKTYQKVVNIALFGSAYSESNFNNKYI